MASPSARNRFAFGANTCTISWTAAARPARTTDAGKMTWPRCPRQAGTSAIDGPPDSGTSTVKALVNDAPHQVHTLWTACRNSCSSQARDADEIGALALIVISAAGQASSAA